VRLCKEHGQAITLSRMPVFQPSIRNTPWNFWAQRQNFPCQCSSVQNEFTLSRMPVFQASSRVMLSNSASESANRCASPASSAPASS